MPASDPQQNQLEKQTAVSKFRNQIGFLKFKNEEIQNRIQTDEDIFSNANLSDKAFFNQSLKQVTRKSENLLPSCLIQSLKPSPNLKKCSEKLFDAEAVNPEQTFKKAFLKSIQIRFGSVSPKNSQQTCKSSIFQAPAPSSPHSNPFQSR